MISATLYLPEQPPQAVSTIGLEMLAHETGFAHIPEVVPALLGCLPGLVDVLASGTEYIAYSVFDFEGETNLSAMMAVEALTGQRFSPEEDDEVLCGPVLIVKG